MVRVGTCLEYTNCCKDVQHVVTCTFSIELVAFALLTRDVEPCRRVLTQTVQCGRESGASSYAHLDRRAVTKSRFTAYRSSVILFLIHFFLRRANSTLTLAYYSQFSSLPTKLSRPTSRYLPKQRSACRAYACEPYCAFHLSVGVTAAIRSPTDSDTYRPTLRYCYGLGVYRYT